MKNILKNKKRLGAILLGILIFSYGIALLPEATFASLTEEDGLLENVSAGLFLLSAVTFFMLFAQNKFFKNPDDRLTYSTHFRRYAFLLLGMVFFFGFGEEISWGQRIFGFETPESLVNHNVQDEFNIHNLEIFNIKNEEGVRKTGLQKMFTMKQMFLATFFLYLFVIPLVVNNNKTIDRLLKRFYLPVPPLWIGAFFLGNYVFYRIWRLILPWELQWGLTEIQEFNFSLILMLLPFAWFGWPRKAVD